MPLFNCLKRTTVPAARFVLTIACLFFSFLTFAQQAPVISGISPVSGPIGTRLTIQGKNFTAFSSIRSVYIGDVRATEFSATDTTIVVEVPRGAAGTRLSVNVNNMTADFSRFFIPTFPGNSPVLNRYSFAPALQFASGGVGGRLDVADFERNGYPDIVVSNKSSTISIRRNAGRASGNLGFAAGVGSSAGSSVSVATGDLDGDGLKDVVALDSAGTSIVVFTNNTQSDRLTLVKTLTISTSVFGIPEHPVSVTLGDLNGDGKPEMILANYGRASVTTYLNTSTPGKISFGEKSTYYPYGFFNNVAVSDLNQDGKPEVIISMRAPYDVRILTNNSSAGAIVLTQSNILSIENNVTGTVSAGDLDGDGKPDLAFVVTDYSGTANPGIAIYRNTSTASAISFVRQADIRTGVMLGDIIQTDINGDGKPDIAGFQRTNNAISLFQNTSNGAISFNSSVSFPTVRQPYSMAATDFDADGKPDLAVSFADGDSLSVFRNMTGEPLVIPSGQNPLALDVTSRVLIDNATPTLNNISFIRRHYDISSANDVSASTARIKLFFTQEDFNRFNASQPNGLLLPASPVDQAAKAALRIYQYRGSSATAAPGSYNGGRVVIDPADNDIVWNNEVQLWEVSCDVIAFGGFFAGTESTSLAGVKYWTGAVNGAWSDPANWAAYSGGPGGAGAPAMEDSVVFRSNAVVNLNLSPTVRAMTVTNGSTAVLHAAQTATFTVTSSLDVQVGSILRDSTSTNTAGFFYFVLKGTSAARASILGRWEFVGRVPLPGNTGPSFNIEQGAVCTVGNNSSAFASAIVFGTNSGAPVATTTSLVFTHGSNFIVENNNAPLIPKATWAGFKPGAAGTSLPDLPPSTITLQGYCGGDLVHLQTASKYGAITVNLSAQQNDLNLNLNNGTQLDGKLTVSATNGKTLTLLSNLSAVNTVTILYHNLEDAGDLVISGSDTKVALSTSAAGSLPIDYRLNVNGSFIKSGGNFSLQEQDNPGGSATLAIRYNLVETGGTFVTGSKVTGKPLAVEMFGPIYYGAVEVLNTGQSIKLSSGSLDNAQHNVTLRAAQSLFYIERNKVDRDKGITLLSPLAVGKLDLVRGTIRTADTAVLTVTNPGPSAMKQTSDSSYIIGPLEFATASATPYRIPTGVEPTFSGLIYGVTYTHFRSDSITIVPGSPAPSVYRAQSFAAAPPDASNLSAPLLGLANNRYWNITKLSGSDAVIKMSLRDSIAGSSFDKALVAAQYTGGKWMAVNGSILTPGNIRSGEVTTTSLSTLGNFTFGIIKLNRPTKVVGLEVRNVASTFAYLNWTPAYDPSGFVKYDIVVSAGSQSKTYSTGHSNITIDSLKPGTLYSVNVYARNSTGSVSESSDTLKINTAAIASGLTYRYYEGDWNLLPDFDSLKPVKSGTAADISLEIKNRGDYFGVVWEGQINIPRPGNYTFEVLSDDGSKFYFNSLYSPAAKPTVDNDGLHWALASGVVNNVSAGLHPFALTFFEKWGGETMELYWTGPGIPRQRIPASAFIESPSSAGNIDYVYYEGDWDLLPDFEKLPPVSFGKAEKLDVTKRRTGVDDYFGFVWNGFLRIDAPGDYVFETMSDDGSKFYFNSPYAGSLTPLVNNDGLHGDLPASAVLHVPVAGVYPVSASFFEKWGGESMRLFYSGPNMPRQEVPASAFVAKPDDRLSPSVPANLKVVNAGGTFLKFSWDASTDDQLVTGYGVYVDGLLRYTTTSREMTIEELVPLKQYAFTVAAIDQAGNKSAMSETLRYGSNGISNAGLNYRYYEGDWDQLPDFTVLTPVKKGVVPEITLGMRNRNDYFGVVLEGYLTIPVSGEYSFELPSDDGSRFYFNKNYRADVVPTLDNDGLHDYLNPPKTTMFIQAGTYPIALTYFEKWGNEVLKLNWTAPGRSKEEIPAAYFTHDTETPSISINGRVVNADKLQTDLADNEGISIYPNPFVDKIMLQYNASPGMNRYVAEIFDAKGKKVFTKSLSSAKPGINRHEIDLSAVRIPAGLYTVILRSNGVVSKVVQMLKGGN